MKGKTNDGVVISETEILAVGTEVEIVDVRYGCETYYMCIIPSGRQIPIDARVVDITDYNTCTNWEQRRYELAKAAMQGILSNEKEVDNVYYEAKYKENIPKTIARFAVDYADALINELKGD